MSMKEISARAYDLQGSPLSVLPTRGLTMKRQPVKTLSPYNLGPPLSLHTCPFHWTELNQTDGVTGKNPINVYMLSLYCPFYLTIGYCLPWNGFCLSFFYCNRLYEAKFPRQEDNSFPSTWTGSYTRWTLMGTRDPHQSIPMSVPCNFRGQHLQIPVRSKKCPECLIIV